MKLAKIVFSVFSSLLSAGSLFAQGGSSHCAHSGNEDALFQLSVFTSVAAGGGSDRDFRHALHGHDPERGLRLQGIELDAFSNLTSYVQGYVNGNFYLENKSLKGEWEEGYVKVHSLPAGFEIRAGRFLTLTGAQNHVHLHDWSFVDADLMTSQFLGEDALAIEGGELSWFYIYENYGVVGLYVSAGEVVGHEEEHDLGSVSHGNEGGFEGSVLSFRASIHHYVNDYHQHFVSLSAVLGENGYGGDNDTALLAAEYTYSWNDRVSESWGPSVDSTVQLMHRTVEWEEAGKSGDSGQLAAMVSSVYNFAPKWDAAARVEWLEGQSEGAFEAEELKRLSFALTRRFSLAETSKDVAAPEGRVRLQYNWDKRGNDDEHSIWLQFNLGHSWSW